MNLKDEILKRLLGGEVSGERLASELGVTRSAVWKSVKQLISDGFDIVAVTNRGYRLKESNVLNGRVVESRLKSHWTVEVVAETDSTNNLAKAKAAEGADRYAVIADSQTAGRGRLNRSFYAPRGAGLYLSAVVRPRLGVQDCGKITAYAAVATARAVEKLSGADVKIKWVNDLHVGGKKICGILTEGGVGLESGALDYAAIGIGVNVSAVSLPPDIAAVATSVEQETGVRMDRCALAAEILDNLSCLDQEISSGEFLREYRSRSCVIGRRVTVNGEYEATAVEIADDCSLLLDRQGETEKFFAGEISIKLENND